MHRISLHPDGITRCATTTTLLATDLAALPTRAATTAPDLLAPAFGLLGTDFLTAYAAAHTTHLTDLAELSAVFASIGTATAAAASTYATHDARYTTALRTADQELRA
ncbi:type VII secretion target [Nocardia sp. NPDC004722]